MTIQIDDDLASRLASQARLTGQTLEEVAADILRRTLVEKRREPFRVRDIDLEVGFGVTKTWDVIDRLERGEPVDPDRR